MPTLRERLAALIAGESNTDADLQKQLDDLRVEAKLDQYSAEGLLAADEQTRAAARKIAQADPDSLETILRAQRATPAAPVTTFAPPSAPRDETEDAIQKYMAENAVPYHEAAIAVVTDIKLPTAA